MPAEVLRAADLLGRRWLLAVLYAASRSGAVRFNEFRQVLGEIPPRTLAERLRELEDAGLIEREVFDDARPPRVEYRLTAEGQRLKALLHALDAFAGVRA